MWCFNAFVVAPETERTETMDFIFRFSLQPSTFLTIESPKIRVFFTTLFFNFVFSFSSFSFSILVIFFSYKRGIGSMMLIFCWNFRLAYLFLICWWYIRFAIWIFILQNCWRNNLIFFSKRLSVREISVLIIFSFVR